MAKIPGSLLKFWLNGAQVPILSATLGVNFDTLEATDTATPGDGKDWEVARATRGFTIEANMYEPLGAEVVSGTLVELQDYIVTGGSIVETQGTFVVGETFRSDGTGTASATNKVKPLGDRITGETMDMTLDSVFVDVTDIDFNLVYDELNSTSSSTAGDSKETMVSRADRETKITGHVMDTDADLLVASPTPLDAIVEFSSTTKVTGKVLLISKNMVDSTSDFAKHDYVMKWLGKPVETNLGVAAGVEQSFKIVLKKGGTSSKEYTGTCICTAKNPKSNIEGLATISYTFKINGALTENEYSA